MKKIAILLNNLGNNQLAYSCIDYINSGNYTKDKDFVIFYEDVSTRIMEPRCATMNVASIHSFSGDIIFTNINQANIILNLVLPNNKIFYLSNIEWLDNPNYEFNYDVLNHPDIKVICRSDYHATALRTYCGKVADGIETKFNIENMI